MKFTQDYLVYPPREQASYPITEGEWARLKRLIKAIPAGKRVWHFLSSLALGVAGAGVFSLFAFYGTPNLPPWVKPAAWAVFSTALVLGLAFLWMDHEQKENITASAADVIREMEIIEAAYVRPERAEALPAPVAPPVATLAQKVGAALMPSAGSPSLQDLAKVARAIPKVGNRVHFTPIGVGEIRSIGIHGTGRQYLMVDFGPLHGTKPILLPEPRLRFLD